MRLRNPFKLLKRKKVLVIEPEVDPIPLAVATAPPVSHGHIVKVKRKPDYELPTQRPEGGRVVRIIPKHLRKLKEYAENDENM